MLWQQKLCYCRLACMEQFSIELVAIHKQCFGDRSFYAAALHVWNSLLLYLWQDVSHALASEALLIHASICGTVWCFGDRSFTAAALHVWNSLLLYLWQDVSHALASEALLIHAAICGTVCHHTCDRM